MSVRDAFARRSSWGLRVPRCDVVLDVGENISGGAAGDVEMALLGERSGDHGGLGPAAGHMLAHMVLEGGDVGP